MPAVMVNDQEAAACSREDTEEMNRERAETYLRQLAEAELRRTRTLPAALFRQRRDAIRLALVAEALVAVGAVDAGTAGEIGADLELAVVVRQPGQVNPASPGQPGLSMDARMRLARVMRRPARGSASGAVPVSGLSTGHTRPAPQRASWRVVPVGQAVKIRDGDVRRDVHLVAYVRSADGARFIVADWPFGSFTTTAADDRGVSYQVRWHGEMAQRELVLRPDPPRQIRWLDLTTAAGEPATRIALNPQIPAPDVTVTRTAHSPGELLLDVIAAQILATAALFWQHNPGQLAAATAHLREFAGDGPGDVIAALHAAGMLPPDSPVPGQLAGLCARLGINGHGITAPPGRDLPQQWQSMLTPARREPQPPPAPGILAATVAELPEMDGTTIAIVGLHHGKHGTIMHLLASNTTLETGGAYNGTFRPMPVLWIHDSDGRWHATPTYHVSPWREAGVAMVSLRIVPALEPGTAWIDAVATGRSAKARARLPLSWS
jgi:hypothetical protein